MMKVRAVLVLLGVGVGGYGALLLLDLGWDNLVATGTWLIGGVILHDAVLAPATIVLAYAATRVLRGRLPAPVIVGTVVLAAATLIAIPVLGREQARPDNATLLDRNYVAGWFLLAGLTVIGVVIALLAERRKAAAGR